MLRPWHTLGPWKTIVWNIIQLQLCSFDYGPGTDLGHLCTVTLTLQIWPWVKVIAHPLFMENTCVKYYLNPTWHWGVMARTRISGMCALWHWPWRYDLGSRSWHTFGTWTIIVWNIIQRGQFVTELWSRTQSEQTDRWTDRQTDGRTDRVIPIHQTLFARGGGVYNKYTCSSGGGGGSAKVNWTSS